MKINLDDSRVAITHLILNDREVCEKLAETPLWKTDKVIEVTVQFNGVEMKAETLENVLHQWHESNIKAISEKYDPENFEKRVKARVNELMDGKVKESLDLIHELTEKLESANDLLKWNWEE